MPNLRISNTAPNNLVKNLVPSIMVKSGGSVSSTGSAGRTFGGKGYLIGMLGLTDIQSHTIAGNLELFISDFKPNVRVTI